MLLTWYDTAGDQTNSLERVYGAINTNGIMGNPFANGGGTTIYQLSQVSGAGQTVPWADNLTWSTWTDYQGIGVDYANGTFLAAWGGDARLSTGSGVWTDRISTP